MVLSTFTSGVNTSFSSQLNNNFIETLNIGGKNLIRSLIDRAGIFSAGQDDFYGEAYIDDTGRNNTVLTYSADFSSNKFMYGADVSGSTSAHGVSFAGTSPDSGAVGVLVTARANFTLTSVIKESSCTATRCLIYDVTLNLDSTELLASASFSTHTATFSLPMEAGHYYYIASDNNGSLYNQRYTNTSSNVVNNLLVWNFRGGVGFNIASITGTITSQEKIITHSITNNTFLPTISKAIGVPFIQDWEIGADIKYKLANTAEDSGWLNCGNSSEISSFTAFTSQPTTLFVKLIASSTATSNYPSIRGFAVRAT